MIDLNQNGISDIEEIKDFVVNMANEAWAWLLEELKKLLPRAVAALQAVVNHVLGNVGTSKTLEEIVTESLNILYREFSDIANTIKTDVISRYVGLTAGPQLAPAR